MTRTTLAVSALTLAVGLPLLPACQQAPIAPNSARTDPLFFELYPGIAVDPWFKDKIVTTPERITFTPASSDQAATIMVPLRSLASNEAWVQYRFLWFDDAGVQVGETGWQRTKLVPQYEQQFQAASVSADTVAWRMEVRVAR